ncbi:hypothetical protein M9H77_11309 [Catharanthus roseus]|uniref:Uncharacterized protein n=1 Tax=Catharanthus roseus TaxID=4058 RepID=A0ACC0BE88_CATRO|nr:hypothetical protein M9H77_11309 [Catharanthus roseus]
MQPKKPIRRKVASNEVIELAGGSNLESKSQGNFGVNQGPKEGADQVGEGTGSPINVSTLQDKLNDIPNPFVGSNLTGSAHETGQPSGAKKGVKVSTKTFLVGEPKRKPPNRQHIMVPELLSLLLRWARLEQLELALSRS